MAQWEFAHLPFSTNGGPWEGFLHSVGTAAVLSSGTEAPLLTRFDTVTGYGSNKGSQWTRKYSKLFQFEVLIFGHTQILVTLTL